MVSAPDHDEGQELLGHIRPVLGGRLAWVVLAVGQFAAVIAVLQRSSLAVAAADAYTRFGIAAATSRRSRWYS